MTPALPLPLPTDRTILVPLCLAGARVAELVVPVAVPVPPPADAGWLLFLAAAPLLWLVHRL